MTVPNACNEVIYLKKKNDWKIQVRWNGWALVCREHRMKSLKEIRKCWFCIFFFSYTWWNGDVMECNTDADVDISSFCPANTVSRYSSSVKGRAFHARLVFFRTSCPFRHFTQVSDSRLSFIRSLHLSALPFMMAELTRRITWVVPFLEMKSWGGPFWSCSSGLSITCCRLVETEVPNV